MFLLKCIRHCTECIFLFPKLNCLATWTCGIHSWIFTLTEVTPEVTQPRAVVLMWRSKCVCVLYDIIMCSSAPFLSELLTTGEWRMMFDPATDATRRTYEYGDDLLPGLWADRADWGGCDGRGLWDESYVASCVHDLHIQAAAASTVHRTAHRRRRFLLKLLRKKERKKESAVCTCFHFVR